VQEDEAITVVGRTLKLGDSKRYAPIPLTTERAWNLALCATIFPALVGQPRALMQWFALMRNMHRLTELFHWEGAVKILTKTLKENIHNQQPIYQVPSQTMDDTRNQMRATAAAAGGAAAAKNVVKKEEKGKQHHGKETSGSQTAKVMPFCKQFAQGNCTFGAGCKFQHICARCGEAHAMVNCPARSVASVKTEPPAAAATRGSGSRG
jgi:hypothetical protein